MTGRRAVGLVGVPFVWLGMVAAISLLEAPLKFQAEGVSRTEALAVGQLVFPALNAVEVVWAVTLLVLLWPVRRATELARVWRLALATVGILLVQVAVVRPVLHTSTVAVIAGESEGGSSWHVVYIALEGVKLLLLLVVAVVMVRGVLAAARSRTPADREADSPVHGTR